MTLATAKKDKRDMRDPEQLYERIKTIQNNNKGMTFTKAADIADQMFHAHSNGGSSNGSAIR